MRVQVPGMKLLTDAVDCHVHACPHINARRLDVFEAVRQAAAAGMAGIGLMDNFANSSGMAALAMRELGHLGIDVWGGLIMEPSAGGVSAETVKVALQYGYDGQGARYISLPTHHTRHTALHENRSPAYIDACFHVTPGRHLRDPLPEILETVAASEAVLNLGHLSDAETIYLAEQAVARGVHRILAPASHLHPEIVRALTSLGVYVEFSFFFISPATTVGLTHVDAERHTIPASTLNSLCERIAAAPADRVILSSDSGVYLLPPPVESLRMFLTLLQASGVAHEILRRGVQENPTRLFRVQRPDCKDCPP